MVRAGLCRPGRRGRALEFSFQDLVVLRLAHGLLAAKIPPRRLRRALAQLTHQLPPDRPLSGVRIYADGKQVVARDGGATWRPDSGQVLFTFAVDDLTRRAHKLVTRAPGDLRAARASVGGHRTAWVWFERGLRLEQANDHPAARDAYQRAVEADPQLSDAYINLGRLAHEAGDPPEAVRLYHLALEASPDDPIGHYNLALALEDLPNPGAAVAHYRRAVTLDPVFADAHFNLGRLLEQLGRHAEAVQHLRTYRHLTQKP